MPFVWQQTWQKKLKVESMGTKKTLVIPVYNEELRIDEVFWRNLSLCELDMLILVDDGSTDKSVEIISKLLGEKLQYLWVRNKKNLGKAESIRQGMLWAVCNDLTSIATLDADGACSVTDLNEIYRIHLQKLQVNYPLITSGARVRLAGWNISRTNTRQWLGRIIATLVSLVTKISMYDPQTPIKIYTFPNSLWELILHRPFATRWFVDVELILRAEKLVEGQLQVVEFPIQYFRDVEKSHLKKRDLVKIMLEIFKLWNLSRGNWKLNKWSNRP